MLVSEIVTRHLKEESEMLVGVYIREGELLWPVIKDQDIGVAFKVGLFIEPLGGKGDY